MMRTAIALAICAGMIAAPASAQDTNQGAPADAAPTTVVTGPDTALNNVAQPAIPTVYGEDNVAAAELAQEVPLEPVTMPTTRLGDEGDDDFPWGLIGLIGLIGLLGRVRS